MWQSLLGMNFKFIMWLIPVCFLLHELEEWNIWRWYESTYRELPNFTNFSVRFWLIFISIFGLLFTAAAFIVDGRVSAYLMTVFIMLMIANGLQHIYWTIAFKKYAPGLIFSCIGIFLGTAVIACAVSQGLVNKMVVLCLYLLIVPVIIITVKAGNTMTKPIRAIHAFSIKITGVNLRHVVRKIGRQSAK